MNDLNDIFEYLLNKEDDTMVKYVKEDGIELNKENLPRIFNKLINNPFITHIDVDTDVGFLEIMNTDTCSRFQFGTKLRITDDWVYKAKKEDKKYIGCYLHGIKPTNWLNILYDSDNVIGFALNQKTELLEIYTKDDKFSIPTRYRVIVFTEDGEFVEVFKSITGYIVDDMRKHGYKKVKE